MPPSELLFKEDVDKLAIVQRRKHNATSLLLFGGKSGVRLPQLCKIVVHMASVYCGGERTEGVFGIEFKYADQSKPELQLKSEPKPKESPKRSWKKDPNKKLNEESNEVLIEVPIEVLNEEPKEDNSRSTKNSQHQLLRRKDGPRWEPKTTPKRLPTLLGCKCPVKAWRPKDKALDVKDAVCRLRPAFERVDFKIDGPGGERITNIGVQYCGGWVEGWGDRRRVLRAFKVSVRPTVETW